jgi:hypothetical protein
MILHDTEAEKAFIAPFDAGRFPYDDPSGSRIIRQGWAISLNAAFCVLSELCRPPTLNCVSKERMRELVAEWATGSDHALKAPLLRAASALIEGTPLAWREGVEMMRRVGDFEGQRAALGIAYMASDCDSREGDNALTLADAEIRQHWEANGA